MYLRAKVARANVNAGARRALWLLALGAILYGLVLGDGGLLRIRGLRHENQRLQREITTLRGEQSAVRLDLAQLAQPGSFALEKVARERYGMMRPGERVLHVVGVEADGQPPVPPAPAAPDAGVPAPGPAPTPGPATRTP